MSLDIPDSLSNSRVARLEVGGTRTIAQGTDGLSRGDISNGVMNSGRQHARARPIEPWRFLISNETTICQVKASYNRQRSTGT
jgi:hypothetical protein